MGKKRTYENPQLDMTPMIDVVFELIIFFVVTLKMSVEKDETIRLEDGKHGILLTPEELPPSHLTIDVGLRKNPLTGKLVPHTGRISMCNVEMTPEQIGQRVKERYRKFGEFPVLIRADWRVDHKFVKRVMDACTANGVWKLSFVAVQDRKSGVSKE